VMATVVQISIGWSAGHHAWLYLFSTCLCRPGGFGSAWLTDSIIDVGRVWIMACWLGVVRFDKMDRSDEERPKAERCRDMRLYLS
jgi:hypothetical protein